MLRSSGNAVILLAIGREFQPDRLIACLTSLGYSAPAVATSVESLAEIADQHLPDLLIVDAALMEGAKTPAEPIPSRRGVPVILLADLVEEERLESSGSLPPWGCLPKSCRDREIRLIVETALHVAQLEAARAEADAVKREGEQKFQSLFHNMIDGFAYHQVITDATGRPVDYVFLEVNHAFEQMTGWQARNIIGRRVTEVVPGIDRGEFDWIRVYGQVALTGVPARFEQFFAPQDHWYAISAYSPEQGRFACIVKDITAEKRTREALIENMQKYQVLFESFPLGVIITDPDGVIQEVNRESLRLLEMPEEEQIGKSIAAPSWRIMRPDGSPMPPEEFGAVIALREHRHVSDCEMVFRAPSGNTTWLNVTAVPMPLERYGVAMAFADITERKMAEQALRESENRFRSVVQLSPLGLAIMDSRGVLVECNRALAEMLGYDQSELIGAGFESFTHPEDIERQWELFERLYTGEKFSSQVEKRFVHKDGRLIWVNLTATLIQGMEEKQHIAFAFVEDITERKRVADELKRSESVLRKIFEILPVGLWIADPQGRLLTGNPKGVAIWGAEPHVGQDEYRVFRARRLPSREEIAPDDWALAHTINRGVTVEDELIEIDAFDGRTRTVLNFTAPVIGDDGQILGAIVVNHDITDLKHTEDALIASLREKEILLKELNHRVKNNMQVIISLMSLQAQEFRDPAIKTAFRESMNRIYAMAAVHEALHQSDNLDRIDLKLYLSRLSESIFHTYRTDKGLIDLKIDIADDIAVRLEQSYPVGLIINELLSNALKYAFPDDRPGRIGLRGRMADPERLILRLEDDGVGLPADLNWRRSESLGLKIVRALVEEQLEGVIELETGSGSHWNITFPV